MQLFLLRWALEFSLSKTHIEHATMCGTIKRGLLSRSHVNATHPKRTHIRASPNRRQCITVWPCGFTLSWHFCAWTLHGSEGGGPLDYWTSPLLEWTTSIALCSLHLCKILYCRVAICENSWFSVPRCIWPQPVTDSSKNLDHLP